MIAADERLLVADERPLVGVKIFFFQLRIRVKVSKTM